MSLLYECASSRRTSSQDVARLSDIRALGRQDLKMVAECSRHLVLSIDDSSVPLKRAFLLATPAIYDGHFEGEETTMNYPESQRRGLLPDDDFFRTTTRRQSGEEEEEEEQLASAATCVRGARSSATTTCRTIA